MSLSKVLDEMQILTMLITCSLLTLLVAVVFGKVMCGTRYKVLIWMIVLLLLYNILYVVGTVGQYYCFLIREKRKDENLLVWYLLTSIIESLGDLCFNVAHWLLAMFYLRIAKNMPRVYR